MAPAALGLGLIAPIGVAVILVIAGVDIGDQSSGASAIILTAAQDLAFIGAALFLARQAGRVRAADFGLRTTRLGPAVGWTVLAGVSYLVFAAVWTAAVAGKQHQQDIFTELGVHRSSSVSIAVLAVLICVLAPIAEEFLFRGFCFQALRPSLGVPGAAVAVGVVFGAVHATSTPGVLLVELGFLGFVLCLLRWKTGSLLPCIALHAINNSIAYGSLVGWGWQIPPLVVGALGVIALILVPIARRGDAEVLAPA
jgi:hypothetical protein